jgi:hypothetical protein
MTDMMHLQTQWRRPPARISAAADSCQQGKRRLRQKENRPYSLAESDSSVSALDETRRKQGPIGRKLPSVAMRGIFISNRQPKFLLDGEYSGFVDRMLCGAVRLL